MRYTAKRLFASGGGGAHEAHRWHYGRGGRRRVRPHRGAFRPQRGRRAVGGRRAGGVGLAVRHPPPAAAPLGGPHQCPPLIVTGGEQSGIRPPRTTLSMIKLDCDKSCGGLIKTIIKSPRSCEGILVSRSKNQPCPQSKSF